MSGLLQLSNPHPSPPKPLCSEFGLNSTLIFKTKKLSVGINYDLIDVINSLVT
jgi:hypothetical protein